MSFAPRVALDTFRHHYDYMKLNGRNNMKQHTHSSLFFALLSCCAVFLPHQFNVIGDAHACLSATLRFASAKQNVNENDGSVQITVQRVGDNSNTTTVDFTTANGTAITPADYTTANGTLTFNVGETSKTFAIGIIDNTDADGDKTVNLSLSNAQTNAGEVTLNNQNAAAVLTIVDDD